MCKKILEKAKLVITDIKFNNFVKSFKLKNIYDFYFYIGGPTWEENSIDYLQKINSGLIDKIKWKSDSLTDKETKEILHLCTFKMPVFYY